MRTAVQILRTRQCLFDSLAMVELGYTQVTPQTRFRMLAVRTRHTSPELAVRRVVHAMSYRFRLHRKDLPGTPDIVLPRHQKIVLVHGCFWHGHVGCKRARLPVNNAETWASKIERNRQRDQRNFDALRALGWSVLIVWECEAKDVNQCRTKLRCFLEHPTKQRSQTYGRS